jgi:NAD(P)-dependent dehydrogenase (short-subunit alcohol dehydrogenase family)
VTLLFNNAGILTTGRSWDLPLSAWRRSIDVNVLGVVHGIRAFLPRMLAQGAEGRILNTSSIGGLVSGGEFMGAYQGTKHMVSALTESLDRELRAESTMIRASLICPGAIATAIGRQEKSGTRRDAGEESSEQRFRAQLTGLIAEGMDPAELAAEVFAGIRDNRFWIIPESANPSRIQKRCDTILSGRAD